MGRVRKRNIRPYVYLSSITNGFKQEKLSEHIYYVVTLRRTRGVVV